jgi:hypothetical protein
MKIAKFKILGFSMDLYTFRCEADEALPGAVRVSEYVEVEFPPRNGDDQIQQQAAAVDAEIRDADERHQRHLAELAEKKSVLLRSVNGARPELPAC